jgi:uncharacterized membrane protein YfcA
VIEGKKKEMDVLSSLMIVMFGALIGLVLGGLGGGGSILTIPILVYLLGMNTHVAVTASLVIVGMNALVGILLHYRAGHVQMKKALIFGLYGLVASYIGARLSSLLSGSLLLVLFGLLMLVIAINMLRPKQLIQATTYQSWWMTLLGGLGVGFLTGFLGVGGGFLIVPALVLFLGMSMQDAIGSSLVVITMNSASGLLGHLNSGALPWLEIALFSLTGLVGLWLGTRITKKLPARRLSQIFAVFVLMLAIVILSINLPAAFHDLKMCKCDYLMAAKFDNSLASYQHGLFLPEARDESEAFWSKHSPIEKALYDRHHRMIKKLRHQVITFTALYTSETVVSIENSVTIW